MRIGILHNYTLSGSGSSTYVLGLTKALARLGHTVIVISREDNYEKYSTFSKAYSQSKGKWQECGSWSIPLPGQAIGYTLQFHPYIGIASHPECKNTFHFADCPLVTFEKYLENMCEALEEIARREDIGIINTNHEVPLPFIASRIKKVLKIPYISTFHGSHIEYVLKKNKKYVKYAKEGIEEAFSAIVTTDDVRKRFLEIVPTSYSSFAYIPVGVDTNYFRPISRSERSIKLRNLVNDTSVTCGELSDLNTLIFIGKHISDKGVHIIPYILPKIIDEYPNTIFVTAGDGVLLPFLLGFARGNITCQQFSAEIGSGWETIAGWLAKQQKGYINRIAEIIKTNCIITGFVPQETLRFVLGSSKICLIPSMIEEALPMVVLESMSSGAVPIARDFSGFKEILAKIRNEIPQLVNIENIKGSGEEMIDNFVTAAKEAIRLMSISQNDESLASRLRGLARTNYDWEIIASKIASLCKKAQNE